MIKQSNQGHTADFPDNPVLLRTWRNESVESQHRGAWVYADSSGSVIDGVGEWGFPHFLRSSIKCIQALPLIESGAADRFGIDDRELTLAIASHSAEEQHTAIVSGLLQRLELSVDHLQCGASPAGDPTVRSQMTVAGEAPTALHNNCSGKHAGFLALAKFLGVPLEDYLKPDSAGQVAVREALLEMTSQLPEQSWMGLDGCSAPTFRLPLIGLATAFARVSTPDGLTSERRAACERMLKAAERYPELIAGNHRRICTEIARVSGGRLFPKLGAEAVYAIGVRGEDRGLAIKIGDGGMRALRPLILHLLERFELLSRDELAALEHWRETPMRNWAGLEVGRMEVLDE